MKREEHLLTIVAEESAELTKEISKALRFGLDDGNPREKTTNAENIVKEFNDLFASVLLLEKTGALGSNPIINPEFIKAKQEKIEKYLIYSKSRGKLE